MMQDDLRALSVAIFNDEKKARDILEDIGGQLTNKSPYSMKVAYYQSAAFMANIDSEYQKALDYLQQARQVFERLLDTAAQANIWLDCSAILTNQSNWKEAQNAIDRARKLLKKHSQPHYHAHLLAREGVLHLRLRNVGQASEYLLEADRCFLALKDGAELKDHHIHTLVLSSLGELYDYRNQKEQSIGAYTRVLPIVEEHHLWPRLAWHYLNAGRMYMALNNIREAQQYFEKSLLLADSAGNEVKASLLTNLGIIAMLNENVPQAHKYIQEGAALFPHPEKPSDYENLAKAEWWYAQLCHKEGNQKGRQSHLLVSFQVGLNGADLPHQRRTAMTLSELYAGANNFEEALKWQLQATKLTQEFYEELRKTERTELDARYELERIRQEAQMAKLRVTGLQSRALRAQMNPHFLFNALNAIQGFITSGRGVDATTYLARFAKFMRQTLDYSDLEEVSLDEEINFIERYLDINKKLRFRDKLNFKVTPPITDDASELMIPAMIIQPFVENSIEHGLRPKQQGSLIISFQLTEDDQSLLCIIEDDGVGVNEGKAKQAAHSSEHQTHRSRGLDITRERLGLLHGNPLGKYVTITDRSEIPPFDQTGTRVEVILPLLTS